MRAALTLALLLLAPVAAAAGEGAHDLIVLTRPGASPPIEGAAALALVDGFVVHDASPTLETWLRAHPDVVGVERAVPLSLTADPNLLLTRALPGPAAPSGSPYTGRGVTVAVVDSGVDRAHPDLLGRVVANVALEEGKFVDAAGDSNGHGTHVAGIVAADGASSDGAIRGIATDARIVGVDISEKFTTASAMLAYDWLYKHREQYDIRVVVNAWGRVGEDRIFDPLDPEIRAIDKLVDSGVVVLFSASNHGPSPGSLSLEAQDPRVITVGATNAASELMSYSSRGPVSPPRGEEAWVKPDLVAPGDSIVNIKSTTATPSATADVDALHRAYSGTSQAVPHVAGIVALMLEANPSLQPNDVQNALRESAIDLGPPGPDDATGFGLVDAVDAVNRARGLPNDRLNTLVAGGSDRFEERETLAAPERSTSILGFASTPTLGWSTSFPVKPGATVVTFDLSWGASVAPVSVTLEKEGAVQGSWSQAHTEAGRAVVRGRIDEPTPGIWTLRAQGGAPVALEVSSLVEVAIKASPERAGALDPRYRLPETTTSPVVGPVSVLANANLPLVPILGGAAATLALAGLVGAVVVLRKRRRVAWEPVLEEYFGR